jgi:glycosyltransferase involved in cell wall biosynthesis
VLFCGTVEPRKNLPRLVEAFRQVARERDDVELVLVGPNGWLEDGRALLAGLEGRARSIGFVPEPDLRALYELATVVAYPSIREGFGLPVIEAMAQGALVVTSSTTATAEVAGDAALTVDPLDVDAIADALARAIDDPTLRTRLAEPARAQAGRFTWRRSAELTVAAYREAVG